MNPDITRDTFDRRKHYARVLLQQGRVTLDADANEQTAILLHLLRTLARDVYGDRGGPAGNTGFEISLVNNGADLKIGTGHYYVDGILCEHEPRRNTQTGQVDDEKVGWTYLTQPDYPLPPDAKLPPFPCIVYLDVWEQPVSYLEDAAIREVALGGPDTAARSKVVWQVRTRDGAVAPNWSDWEAYRGMLKARVTPSEASDNPCIISPESRYRGAENQLYRVEIHAGGAAGDATFKWSRDNGAICFGVKKLSDQVALLDSLGPDSRRSLEVDDWVEVVDDLLVLRGERPCPLARVAEVRPDDVSVRLDGDVSSVAKPGSQLYLRRWDHPGRDEATRRSLTIKDGALLVQESASPNDWLRLEDGVEIQFNPAPAGQTHTYRTGDYWLIPARVASGNVEWPGDGKGAVYAAPPHGVHHHYALIASVAAPNQVTDKRHP